MIISPSGLQNTHCVPIPNYVRSVAPPFVRLGGSQIFFEFNTLS